MLDDRLHNSRVRAARAEALVNDELLTEAFDRLEATYVSAWKATNIHDDKGREKLFLAVNVIGKIRDHLKTIIADGKIANAELNRLIEDQERRKRFGII